MSVKRVLVAQMVDDDSSNPQSLNVRCLLSRFRDENVSWVLPYHRSPAKELTEKPGLVLVRLSGGHLWPWHKLWLYQIPCDAIFYPGPFWFDLMGLGLRYLMGRSVPIITTLEGIPGNQSQEDQFRKHFGHEVHCLSMPSLLERQIKILHRLASRIIAISPFLKSIGTLSYGSKVSVQPLGVDTKRFSPALRQKNHRFRVMGAGRLYANKRPDLFLTLAEQYPEADFIWFGDGEMRSELVEKKKKKGIENVYFPGGCSNEKLAEGYRTADLFVLPSLSEGVPKVVQEACSSGLPAILFGFYQAPLVINGHNGFVVWNETQLIEKVGELIQNPGKAHAMGFQSRRLALLWSWDSRAPHWEEEILSCLP